MALGIYVHIPFCLKRCDYCDFATYEIGKTILEEDYIPLILREIDQHSSEVKDLLCANNVIPINTIYFGGGTPSIIDPSHINSILQQLQKRGFIWNDQSEITLEINPATMNDNKFKQYLQMGINRFSVGIQTFNPILLKKIGRIHNEFEARSTLEILAQHNANYSFDLLYALPDQSLVDLEKDLCIATAYKPKHLSAYCLNVANTHPLAHHQPDDEVQNQMVDMVDSFLNQIDVLPYEISNYCAAGFESKHNLLYWSDENYWGLGSAAHSYLKCPPWGLRFWNPPVPEKYAQQLRQTTPIGKRISTQEILTLSQAMTDFCHTQFRLIKGMSFELLQQKFPPSIKETIENRIELLCKQGLVCKTDSNWELTRNGRYLNNQIHQTLTFLDEDLK